MVSKNTTHDEEIGISLQEEDDDDDEDNYEAYCEFTFLVTLDH